MNTPSLLNPLERALNQSQALLSLAQADDWESFETLVQQRQQGLLLLTNTEYLTSLAEAELDTQAAGIIKDIQSINQQLAVLAQQNREEIASELRQSAQAEKAINAYSQ